VGPGARGAPGSPPPGRHRSGDARRRPVGLPRHRPPFAAQVGLFGRPTLINNVETLYWVRDIVEKGPDWFTGQGRNGRQGLRTFSVSGRVREPGVKLAPAGITARELIAEFCGGMADGHAFKGYLPGGASGGILPTSLADIPLVHFNSPANLKSLSGGAYEQTDASGVALTGATGQIVGGSLEQSNTDIATEFTKLIVTQQAYSANTKVITTANQMSQDLMNILR
jgi:hypothetical protein